MGSKRKARSRAARRSRDLESPVSRHIEEDVLVGRDYNSDESQSVQSEKEEGKLIETPANNTNISTRLTSSTPQTNVESEIFATNAGKLPAADHTCLLHVTNNTLLQHNSGDVPVTSKSSFTPVSFSDVIQVPSTHTRAPTPSSLTNVYKGNNSVHSLFSHEVSARPPLFLSGTQGPVASPLVSLRNPLPDHLQNCNTGYLTTLSTAHSVPHNHSPSMTRSTFMHCQEPLHIIQSGHVPNSSKPYFNVGTLGPVHTMSSTHNTGYVPVISHTGQFLPVSSPASTLPAACTGQIPVLTSLGNIPIVSSMGFPSNYPSYYMVQNASATSCAFGRSQNGAPNNNTSHGFQNYLAPPNDAPLQIHNDNVSPTSNIAQLIQAEVEKAVQKLSAKMQHARPATNKYQYEDNSDSDLEDTESSDARSSVVLNETKSRDSRVKLPPFNGKEDWKIWYARFEEIAERKRWSEKRKLDELLPCFHGVAAEFVYGQLTKSTRRSYRKLTEELNNRFRVVETRKTFISKFSNRQQKPGERVEDYAAELKRLYDKAHPKRNSETREEDLLRRFLDGLADGDAQFHVEYVKEPENIDEAVLQVVNFEETGRAQKNKQKAVRQIKEQKTEARSEAFKKFPKGGQIKSTAKQTEEQQRNNDLEVQLQKLSKELEFYKQKYGTKEETEILADNRTNELQQVTNHMKVENGDKRIPTIVCYCCKQNGHYARECPLKITHNQTQQPVVRPHPLNGH